MKTCIKCSIEKHEELFYKNKSRVDGLDQYCTECRASYTRKWSKTDAGKSCRKTARSRYYKKNKDKELARSSLWRRGKRLGTLSSLSKEQLEEIDYKYFLARDCYIVSGQEYHVDHIHPICREDSCGLHVPWNLQVLPKDLNMSKGNKV